ncbi:MAG: mechanosensitive ion channel [Candidatus Thermoplasmatota archaeon]|nr:mechanosensitive ion channel [Candidatus Thermoplasmatota archaeon]
MTTTSYKKTSVRKVFVLYLILLCFLFSFVGISSSQPFIGDDGDYSKNVETGKSDQFDWVVYRNDSSSYVVSVTVSGFEKWSQQISPAYFVLDDQQPYQIVTLLFDVPLYPELSQRDAKIIFTFRVINSSSFFTITKNVAVDVSGITYSDHENFILNYFENQLPSPFNTSYGTLLINILIWVAIAWFSYFIIRRFILVFTEKTKTKFDDILIEIIRRPIIILIIIYGIISSILQLNINIGVRTNIYQIYSFIVVIIALYVALRAFNEFLDEFSRKKGGKKAPFNAVLKPVFKKIGLIIILTAGLIFALNSLGINVTALLAGAGVMGLVVAFAAQDTLSNFFSGMHLLLDRPFKIGDIILLESGEYCQVENVGMRSTKLYSIFDHELIVLPNNSLANQKIVNLVQPDNRIKVRLNIGVAYGSDVKKVMGILSSVALDHENVVKDAGLEPVVRFSDFADSSLNFFLIVWVDDVMNQWKVLSDLREKIDVMFKENGVEIPFPQRTVWLHHVDEKQKEPMNEKQPSLKET